MPVMLCRLGVKTTTSFSGISMVQMPEVSVIPVRESMRT
jgi:hypothetical protein